MSESNKINSNEIQNNTKQINNNILNNVNKIPNNNNNIFINKPIDINLENKNQIIDKKMHKKNNTFDNFQFKGVIENRNIKVEEKNIGLINEEINEQKKNDIEFLIRLHFHFYKMNILINSTNISSKFIKAFFINDKLIEKFTKIFSKKNIFIDFNIIF